MESIWLANRMAKILLVFARWLVVSAAAMVTWLFAAITHRRLVNRRARRIR